GSTLKLSKRLTLLTIPCNHNRSNLPHWNPTLSRKLPQQPRATNNQLRLQTARLLVNPRMNNTTIPTTSMSTNLTLLLKHRYTLLRMRKFDLPPYRTANNPTTNNHKIITLHNQPLRNRFTKG